MGPYISREIRFVRSVCIVNLRKEVEMFVWSVFVAAIYVPPAVATLLSTFEVAIQAPFLCLLESGIIIHPR